MAASKEDVTSETGLSEFDWIQLRKDMGESVHVETPKERLYRKMQENPAVPIGCLATATALTVGLWSFRHGKQKMSQQMMRLRIAAQGFTVCAVICGVLWSAGSKANK